MRATASVGFCSDIASYGYFVIALGPIARTASPMPTANHGPDPPETGQRAGAGKLPPPATHSAQLIDASTGRSPPTSTPAARFYHHLKTDAIAVMGQSCGGAQAIEASADPRVRTTVIWNSGLFREPTRMAGGKPLTKKDLDLLHAPTAYISGDAEDIAYRERQRGFRLHPANPRLQSLRSRRTAFRHLQRAQRRRVRRHRRRLAELATQGRPPYPPHVRRSRMRPMRQPPLGRPHQKPPLT